MNKADKSRPICNEIPLSRQLAQLACVVAVTAMCSLHVSAQTDSDSDTGFGIEEVLVTAERRQANLQDVAIAVSAFSRDQLQAQQVSTIGDLQALVPNLSIHAGDANNAVAYIRGIGQIDSIAFFEPGVGIYLDDVYLGRAQGAFLDVVDVKRIEVLRGPQGSLYGRNTVGGCHQVCVGNTNRRAFRQSLGDTGRLRSAGSASDCQRASG